MSGPSSSAEMYEFGPSKRHPALECNAYQATETAPPLQTADLAADEGCREGHTIPSSSPRGEWQQLAAEPDIERVVEMFKTAIDRDAQGFDIGFAPTGRPTRVVWADVEVIRVGVLLPEELPPDVPPGSKAAGGSSARSPLRIGALRDEGRRADDSLLPPVALPTHRRHIRRRRPRPVSCGITLGQSKRHY